MVLIDIAIRIILKTMDDFQAVNKVYAEFFKKELPARVCIAVKELPKRLKVGIEVIAV